MLGQSIKKLRRELHISQAELAEKLGISLDTMSRWENGRREPRYSDIIMIAKILQTTPSQLLQSDEGDTAKNINLQQNKNINCTQIVGANIPSTPHTLLATSSQDIISLIVDLRNKIKSETLSPHESTVVKDLLLLCLQDCNSNYK